MTTVLVIALTVLLYFLIVALALRFIAFVRRCDEQMRSMGRTRGKKASLHFLS
ncbi:MAG: hypothetical protein HYW57_09450 [Ignavibacteriales bacterium]|nr:hypothetical protein [Ignavibacteriales bacterium]